MQYIYYKAANSKAFKEIPSIKKGCWVHIEGSNEDDLKALCDRLKIDIEDIIDALDPYEMPRLEKHQNYTLLFTRMPTDNLENLHTQTFTIILCKDVILTLCPRQAQLISQITTHCEGVSSSEQTKLMLRMLLKITEAFHKKIRRVQNNVLKTKGQVEHADSAQILSLTKNEEVLNQYQSALASLGSALEQLAKGKIVKLTEDEKEELDDLLNALKQSFEASKVHLKGIKSLRSCYQMIFTNTLNKTTKILTSLAVIFMIPTLLASLYGMNVGLPFSKEPAAFVGILIVSAVLSAIALVVFYWKRWL